MSSTTALVSRFFADLSLDDVPATVQHEAKRILLDTLGCVGGGRLSEISGLIDSLALRIGGSGEDCACTLVGHGKASLLAAAYGNARMGNALDFDETFPVGAHFGVGAVSAALAMAEDRQVSGRDLLKAVIIGYELGARVATYIGPMAEVEDGKVKGFARVWGVSAPVVLAAMGAAASIAKLEPKQFAQAIGLAVSNCPLPAGALWSKAVDLPDCKYCDAGWCTMAGVFAVLSVEAGSSGFDDAFDGPNGLALMCGVANFDESHLTTALGRRWLLADVTYKLWPTCRFTHSALTALARILKRQAIAPNEILEIVVETGPMAASARFTNPFPRTFAGRCFSYPHMIAMLVRGIEPGPQWLDKAIVTAPATTDIAQKVRIEAHARGDDFAKTITGNQLRTMPGGVRIRTTRGEFRDDDDYALGDPWNDDTRVDDTKLIEKFLIMCGGHARSIATRLLQIECEASVAGLVQEFQEGIMEKTRAHAA